MEFVKQILQHPRCRLKRKEKNVQEDVQMTGARMMHLREQKKLKEIRMVRNYFDFLFSSTFDFDCESFFNKNRQFDLKTTSKKKILDRIIENA